MSERGIHFFGVSASKFSLDFTRQKKNVKLKVAFPQLINTSNYIHVACHNGTALTGKCSLVKKHIMNRSTVLGQLAAIYSFIKVSFSPGRSGSSLYPISVSLFLSLLLPECIK